MSATLEWLGTATFRLTIGDLVIFLDTYMDRVPDAPPIGLTSADVAKADYILMGHSHFDHLGSADIIARNTGARIIGSNETCRVMRERGVPDGQLLASQGGERHALAAGVNVRAFPSVHSCTWILTDAPADEDERGHTGLTQNERAAQPGLMQRIFSLASTPAGGVILEHLRIAGRKPDRRWATRLPHRDAGGPHFLSGQFRLLDRGPARSIGGRGHSRCDGAAECRRRTQPGVDGAVSVDGGSSPGSAHSRDRAPR